MQRDETAVEPFRLAPINNYNPDRKQANGAYPVYDPPTALPTVRMEVTEVRPTTPSQAGRTRYNPPAYTEPSPEAGENRSTPTVDTQHSFTSGGSTFRSNTARGNVIGHLAPPGAVKKKNSHGAVANASANAVTGHGRELSGDTFSDMDRKRRPDTDDSFSVRDIA